MLVLVYFVSFAAIGSPDTTWAHLVSWFPATAPIAMPTRIAMGAASWWDPLVAVALTVAAIAGLVVFGGRVYAGAVLAQRADAQAPRRVAPHHTWSRACRQSSDRSCRWRGPDRHWQPNHAEVRP